MATAWTVNLKCALKSSALIIFMAQMNHYPYLNWKLKGQARTHRSAMLKLFRKSGKSDEESKVHPKVVTKEEKVEFKVASIQPTSPPRKTVLTVMKKPEESNSSSLVNEGCSRPPDREVFNRKEEPDFLLAEMQALLDPQQSGKVKGEDLQHILASIGNRWNQMVFLKLLNDSGSLTKTWLRSNPSKRKMDWLIIKDF